MGGAGPGCMHSKLQLLKYKDHLRIVVPSANLVPYDWGETGVMENVRSANPQSNGVLQLVLTIFLPSSRWCI